MPGEPQQPRFALQRVLDLLRRARAAAQQVEDRAGVQRARARRHRHAFERAESHRRIHGATVPDGAHRAAAAEMADHQARDPHLLAGPLQREAVKAVAADVPVGAPALGHGVHRGLLGHGRVELGIEDGDLRQPGQGGARLLDRLQRRGVVQRREIDQRVQGRQRAVVQEHGRAEARTSVHDAVPHGDDVARRLAERGERPAALGFVDRRELEAGRAGVDDQDAGQAISPATSSPRRQAGPRRGRGCTRATSGARPPCPAAPPRRTRPARARGRSRPSRGDSGRGR